MDPFLYLGPYMAMGCCYEGCGGFSFVTFSMSSVLSSRKSLTVALVALSAVLIVSMLLYSPFFRQYTVAETPTFRTQSHSCPPQAYAAGNWTRKPNPPVMSTQDDVLAVSGFEGCASTREINLHLGVGWKNKAKAAQKLQWRGNASAYEWLPGEGCEGYTRVTRENLVRQLVEDGGWLLLGGASFAEIAVLTC